MRRLRIFLIGTIGSLRDDTFEIDLQQDNLSIQFRVYNSVPKKIIFPGSRDPTNVTSL